jgi:hypothetical protein
MLAIAVYYTLDILPNILYLYTDLQMAMLKSAIASGTVIGIDQTFNLSSCFPDLPWSLTVLNPITENEPLMGSQATVRDCSMLGIAVYYTRDCILSLINCKLAWFFVRN